MSAIIEVDGLVKQFGSFTAVDGVNFEVQEGEIFGFLGPNGAGKTTTINILATLLPATSGTARLAGFDVRTQSNQVRQSIGMVFQDASLDDRLTADENLTFHAMLYNVPRRCALNAWIRCSILSASPIGAGRSFARFQGE